MAEQKYEKFQSNTTSQKTEIGKPTERLPKQGSSNQLLLATSKIEIPSFQPRRFFEQQKLEQLAKSIQNYGILENLIVRPLKNGSYELVAGERRLRAAISVGLAEVPVAIHELTDEQALSLALVENLQRTDLNPIEETEGVLRLLALRLDITTDEVVALLYRLQNEVRGKTTHNIIGSSQFHQVESVFSEIGRFTWESFIINRLPLLKMPSEILDLVREGKLAYTKAQAIARVKDPDLQRVLLDETLSKNLSLGQLCRKIQTSLKTIAPVPTVPQNLLDQTYKRIQASKAWSDPQKRERVKELLRELSALLEG